MDESFRAFLADVVDVPVMQGWIEQGVDGARVWFKRATESKELLLNGDVFYSTTNFDVEVISEDLAEAQELAAEIKDAIHGYRGSFGGQYCMMAEWTDHNDDYDVMGLGYDENKNVAALSVSIIHRDA